MRAHGNHVARDEGCLRRECLGALEVALRGGWLRIEPVQLATSTNGSGVSACANFASAAAVRIPRLTAAARLPVLWMNMLVSPVSSVRARTRRQRV
jgi:hypothetical protein